VTRQPHAPAAERNREPILAVLRVEFADRRSVLEIGSGTGQHAVWFARHLPSLTWQPTDLPDRLAGISSWIRAESVGNVLPPRKLDVLTVDDVTGRYDAMFSSNTTHIMGIEGVRAMFRIAGSVLLPGGKLCVYGPFRFQGEFTSESNRAFDASLRDRSPAMGIRDIESLDSYAAAAGLVRSALYAMPANNFIVVWSRP